MTPEQLAAIVEDLLPIVKNYLNITWDETSLDEKITGHIKRGVAYVLSWSAGMIPSFSEGSKEVELLLDYCLYVHNYSLSLFYDAYLAELQSYQMGMEVLYAEEQSTETTSTSE